MSLKNSSAIITSQFCIFFFTTFVVLCCFSNTLNAQSSGNDNLIPVQDLGDRIKKLLHKKVDTTKVVKSRNVAIIPSLGYNPSFGFVFGAKATAIKNLGKDENTDLSSFGLESIYTSKGIIT